jgi:hypothetical protein
MGQSKSKAYLERAEEAERKVAALESKGAASERKVAASASAQEQAERKVATLESKVAALGAGNGGVVSTGPSGPKGSFTRKQVAMGFAVFCFLASKVGKEVWNTDTIKGFIERGEWLVGAGYTLEWLEALGFSGDKELGCGAFQTDSSFGMHDKYLSKINKGNERAWLKLYG